MALDPKLFTLNFQDPAQARRFPRHRWSRNSFGVQQLWLPILQILQSQVNPIRIARGAKPIDGERPSNFNSFWESVRLLEVVLRDLDTNSRRFLEAQQGLERAAASSDNNLRDHYVEEISESQTYCQLSLEAAFSSARRLADRFADVVRPLIFEHIGSLSPAISLV